ncbi:hypothetical protein [Streptomyces fructofermentans]|uniref:hypothetical protein n=1 Tax=Streptomyces fructofermentans TaxID=152141 RepID=UPI0033E01A3E
MDFDVQNHARTRALPSDACTERPVAVRYDRNWPSPFADYAIPDDEVVPTASEVRALISTLRTLDRVPRLEYLPSCAPQAEPVLLAALSRVPRRPLVRARASHQQHGQIRTAAASTSPITVAMNRVLA